MVSHSVAKKILAEVVGQPYPPVGGLQLLRRGTMCGMRQRTVTND